MTIHTNGSRAASGAGAPGGAAPPAGGRRVSRPLPKARIALLWASIRDSLWFIPTVATAVSVALALIAVRIDRVELAQAQGWVFQGGADGARGVLTAIAGSIITVTGVVFSVTIVALQLASSQFTPRALRGFVADRVNQVVLGIFIGTFTYTLLVLRTVQAEGRGQEPFVPALAVTLAVALVVVSIGALIFYINHAARSVQASFILDRETRQTLRHVDALFPEAARPPSGRAASVPPECPPPACPPTPPAAVEATRAGYLQAVHTTALFEAAEARGMTMRMEVAVGEFVLPGEPLVSVWPPELADEETAGAVREAFVIGHERTPEQDVEFGIVVISDMAVKALSPGINDPTTAMLCIDRLGEILVSLGRHPDPLAARTGEGGALRFVARSTTFDRAVGLAFDQIRHFGASNVTIGKKLLDTIGRVAQLVPEARRAPLRAQAEALLHAGRSEITTPGDLAALERVGGQSLEACR